MAQDLGISVSTIVRYRAGKDADSSDPFAKFAGQTDQQTK